MTDGLTFPFAEPPPIGQPLAIAEGIYWLRMGLPLALDHINLYLLEADGGWYVVDTGMGLDASREVWERVFAEFMKGLPVLGVVATHMHPDHVGLAGWLCERFRVPLMMSQAEYFAARCYSAPPAEVSWATKDFFHGIGMDDAFIDTLKRRMRGFGAMISPLPGSYQRLQDGQTLQLGQHRWQVVVGSGHSPEHACLYSEALGLLLSGDQVIAGISSNVSVMATEPDANPLKSWLASHQRLMALPADTLVCPAHNLPFTGLHGRLQQLMDHHEERMLALEEACVEPKGVLDLLPVMFSRELGDGVITMAIGECLSHLHLLMERARIERTRNEQGVYQYRSIAADLMERATGQHQPDDISLMV
ncbi:MAG TPA: MBL fold metallo-hydrolase [Pseudomonadales bacterium]